MKPVLSPASPPAGSPIPVHCGGPEHPDPDLVERFMRSELAGDDRRRIVRHLLADRDADLHARDVEERQRLARCDEIALLVEHRVVGQQLLAVHAVDAAVRADRRDVVQVAARLRK